MRGGRDCSATPGSAAAAAARDRDRAGAAQPALMARVLLDSPSRKSTTSRISRITVGSRPIGRFGWLTAALAAANASIASDLPKLRTDLRSLLISFGGTRSTRSPCSSSIRSSPPDQLRQSSSAHTRSESRPAAHTKSSRCPAARAATVRSSIHAAVSPLIAAAVCVWLCASTPITITLDPSIRCDERIAGGQHCSRASRHAPIRSRRPSSDAAGDTTPGWSAPTATGKSRVSPPRRP